MIGSTLKERLRADLIIARKERDKPRTLLLTTTLSELRNREIEMGGDAADADVVEVVGRAIKRRKEAAEQMRAGGRDDLAEKEEQEAVSLGTYLPPPLDDETVRGLVREAIAAGATTVGAVMSVIMPQIKGRFDGRDANRIVRDALE
jgi:uncharacterized protein